MSALICDLCGGKLTMGSGGISTCESCGMEHSMDRMKEKIQEVKGTVKVDKTHMIDNYLKLGYRAYDANNISEAEEYSNKILEIDPHNYEALMLKGRTAGWQSSLTNMRFSESINNFSEAINYAPEENRETLIEESKTEIKNLTRALMKLQADRYARWPDEEETNAVLGFVVRVYEVLVLFITSVGESIDKDEMMKPIAEIINESVVAAWTKVILPEYEGEPEDYPSDYDWKKFKNRTFDAMKLLKESISLSDADDADDIIRYQNLIHLYETVLDSSGWENKSFKRYSGWDGSPYYEWKHVKSFSLTEEAKTIGKEIIEGYKNRITEIQKSIEDKEAKEKIENERIEEAEKQKRIDEYWVNNKKEKQNLEVKKEGFKEELELLDKKLNKKLEILNSEINEVQGMDDIEDLKNKIKELKNKKELLGIFKRKEKNELENMIEQHNEDIKIITDKRNAEIKIINEKIKKLKTDFEQKIKPIRNNLDEIELELTRDRS